MPFRLVILFNFLKNELLFAGISLSNEKTYLYKVWENLLNIMVWCLKGLLKKVFKYSSLNRIVINNKTVVLFKDKIRNVLAKFP